MAVFYIHHPNLVTSSHIINKVRGSSNNNSSISSSISMVVPPSAAAAANCYGNTTNSMHMQTNSYLTKYLNGIQCYLCCHFRVIQNHSSAVLHRHRQFMYSVFMYSVHWTFNCHTSSPTPGVHYLVFIRVLDFSD